MSLFCARGVASISFPTHGSCIYTAGADGMLCEINSLTGNMLRKFKASTKAISCISVSPGIQMLTLFFSLLNQKFTKNDSHNSNGLEIWNWFFEEFGLTWLDIGFVTCKEMIEEFLLHFTILEKESFLR